ncbi:hypothetical protein B0H63DRAFT_230920 [Podospora didyma]|uniref:Secreted protein n=1 Tax=Podospora didyma TaxID=330526 RepID=A0AAE0NBI1_9PEZI|nr:hypothetical protein B0H63DRAFT_230920 [Podospora didyma]
MSFSLSLSLSFGFIRFIVRGYVTSPSSQQQLSGIWFAAVEVLDSPPPFVFFSFTPRLTQSCLSYQIFGTERARLHIVRF